MVACGNCAGQHASIDEVRRCFNAPLPERSSAPGDFSVTGPTERQRSFILSLLQQLDRDEDSLPKPIIKHSVVEASKLIGSLLEDAKNAPVRTAKATPTLRGTIPADGTYTIGLSPDGEERVTLRFKAPKHGKFAGVQLVKYLFGPNNDEDYRAFGNAADGGYRVWLRYKDNERLTQALQYMLMADNVAREEMGMAYALQSSNCYRCGRTLTVPASIHRGLGPDCAAIVAVA